MPLRVICRAQYLSEPVEDMRARDYNATHLVKAVKGLDLNPKAYTWVKIAGRRVKITETNKDEAIRWFAAWAARRIDVLGDADKVLVPVPGSSVVRTSPDDFRTALIARAIAARSKTPTVVAAVLRWKTPMTPSRDGGPRDPRILYPNIVLKGALPDGTLVLVDDVYTSGGHLIASAWRLVDQGRTVDFAVCCGRSLHYQLDNPFSVAEESLDLTR